MGGLHESWMMVVGASGGGERARLAGKQKYRAVWRAGLDSAQHRLSGTAGCPLGCFFSGRHGVGTQTWRRETD